MNFIFILKWLREVYCHAILLDGKVKLIEYLNADKRERRRRKSFTLRFVWTCSPDKHINAYFQRQPIMDMIFTLISFHIPKMFVTYFSFLLGFQKKMENFIPSLQLLTLERWLRLHLFITSGSFYSFLTPPPFSLVRLLVWRNFFLAVRISWTLPPSPPWDLT